MAGFPGSPLPEALGQGLPHARAGQGPALRGMNTVRPSWGRGAVAAGGWSPGSGGRRGSQAGDGVAPSLLGLPGRDTPGTVTSGEKSSLVRAPGRRGERRLWDVRSGAPHGTRNGRDRRPRYPLCPVPGFFLALQKIKKQMPPDVLTQRPHLHC